MIARPLWTLSRFEQFVEIALEVMAKEGAVGAGADSLPLCQTGRAVRAEDGTVLVELTADLTPVGLGSRVRMTVAAQADGRVCWRLAGRRVATISFGLPPEDAGEDLVYILMKAYRQRRGRGGE